MCSLRIAISALFVTCSSSAFAAGEDDAPAQVVVVTGQRSPYAAPASTTRTLGDLKDVPQAVSIVTAEQIADHGLRALPDVLRFIPGVAISGGEGHRDQIVLRGNATTADFFVDGLRDDVQYYRGLYNLDRLEVLKGPNALLFGRGGGGGVVNRVIKRPLATDFTRGAVAADSFGASSVETDVNLALSGGFAARLNAVAERFDNQRDFYDGHRLAINPTVAWQNDRTRIDLGFEWSHDRRLIDRGVPSDARGRGAPSIADPARPLTGFARMLFGDPGLNRTRFDGRVATARFEQQFAANTRLSVRALVGDYDKYYRNVLAVTPAQGFTSGGVTATRVGIEAYDSGTRRRNHLLASDLSGTVRTGPLTHRWLVGADVAIQHTDTTRSQGFFAPGPFTQSSNRRFFTPLAARIVVPQLTFTCVRGLGCTDTTANSDAIGVLVQDEIALGEHVDLIAGLRFDRFQLTAIDRINALRLTHRDGTWSPRLGLVIKPTATISLYASFARSFLPQSGDQFSSLDLTTAALQPERFVNREVGAKWRPAPGLDVTLAAYRLDRTNTRAVDPVSGLTVLTGAQRSRGVELQVQGALTSRLSLTAGLALQDARLTRTTTAAPADRRVPLVPKVQVSLWAKQELTRSLGVGLGAYHQSRSFASISNAVILPAFTRIDAAAFVKLTKAVELQLNVENLLDRTTIGTAFNDNNLTPANPRTLRLSLRFGL